MISKSQKKSNAAKRRLLNGKSMRRSEKIKSIVMSRIIHFGNNFFHECTAEYIPVV